MCVAAQRPSNLAQNPLHHLERSITIAWPKTAPHLDTPSSLYAYKYTTLPKFAVPLVRNPRSSSSARPDTSAGRRTRPPPRPANHQAPRVPARTCAPPARRARSRPPSHRQARRLVPSPAPASFLPQPPPTITGLAAPARHRLHRRRGRAATRPGELLLAVRPSPAALHPPPRLDPPAAVAFIKSGDESGHPRQPRRCYSASGLDLNLFGTVYFCPKTLPFCVFHHVVSPHP